MTGPILQAIIDGDPEALTIFSAIKCLSKTPEQEEALRKEKPNVADIQDGMRIAGLEIQDVIRDHINKPATLQPLYRQKTLDLIVWARDHLVERIRKEGTL